jgi:hypothetical protein
MTDTPNSPVEKPQSFISRATGMSEEEVAAVLKGTDSLANLRALADPMMGITKEMSIPQFAPPHQMNPAEWTYDRLVEYIKDFESDLDNEHEIGGHLVSGSGLTFHMTDMGFYGPDIICFYGVDSNGQRVQLIQNISQLSVLLVALKKMDEKPRRLGFILDQKNTE